MRGLLFLALLASVFLTALLRADCAEDHRSNKSSGILVTDFTVSGTTTLSSTVLAGITGRLTGSCFDEDSEEMEERVRALFQDLGYVGAEVKSVRFKPGDPLGIPKPVTLEAEVMEGPRYKIGAISFLENHALSSARLRQEFPLKKGDLFERAKVASGLESLRKLYSSNGFLDFACIPDTRDLSNATMSLIITVLEGPQYHMGKLEILAKNELAARLQAEWKLAEGAIYDSTYINRYVEENHGLLPEGFTAGDVLKGYDCPEALVNIRLVVDPAEDTSRYLPKNVPCEAAHDNSK